LEWFYIQLYHIYFAKTRSKMLSNLINTSYTIQQRSASNHQTIIRSNCWQEPKTYDCLLAFVLYTVLWALHHKNYPAPMHSAVYEHILESWIILYMGVNVCVNIYIYIYIYCVNPNTIKLLQWGFVTHCVDDNQPHFHICTSCIEG